MITELENLEFISRVMYILQMFDNYKQIIAV